MNPSRQLALVAGPLLAACFWLWATSPWGVEHWPVETVYVACLAIWMAIWWIFEAVPLGATSLLPLALLPLCGVSPVKTVSRAYMHPFIVLLMTGFMTALAIERWNLHKRVALAILMRARGGPRGLIGGMMCATALCSMWISNTATTLMMLPIALALVARAEANAGVDKDGIKAFGVALFLGIAYSASIGGLGTPIGSPPNLFFLSTYNETFSATRPPVTFGSWMAMGVPLVIVLLPLVWWLLTRILNRVPDSIGLQAGELLREEHRALGPMSREEKTVGAVFLLMAIAWITRRIRLEDAVVGWAPALGLDQLVDDSTVAVVGALLLFALPSSTPNVRMLDWETAKKIPWEVVVLFGGGLALAGAFKTSGLSAQIAQGLSGLQGLPTLVLIGSIALAVTFLTEVTSNTATATILLPVLAAFAVATKLAPELVMVPAVLSASCAFMLPVATAPNAIVYGSGKVSMSDMSRGGLILNLVAAATITLWCFISLPSQ